MKILEIGAAYNPLVPRSRGWNSFSLDHATGDELRRKYAGQQLIERIEEVDFVWKEGLFESSIPEDRHGTFDAVIASHVIEHLPDPLGFLLSSSRVLKDGGVISLVVPDKRFTFDFFKPVSLASDYLCAHRQHKTRHAKKMAFDYVAMNVTERGEIVWPARLVSDFGFIGALEQALAAFDDSVEDETAAYVDFHATVYTPSSLELIILELGQLRVLPFTLACSFPTSGSEFYVTLRKGEPEKLPGGALAAERLRLMKSVVRELAEQARYLHDA